MRSTDTVLNQPDVFYPDVAWIQTFSGRRFHPTKPIIESISIIDIAHSLSRQCRFSGHVNSEIYSVAQHSVLVSLLCDPQDALWGLLHDASEAYLVDIPAPLKRSGLFDAYLSYEKIVSEAIAQRFCLTGLVEPESVKKADKSLLASEAKSMMTPLRSDWLNKYDVPYNMEIFGQRPDVAKEGFIKRFCELVGDNDLYDIFIKDKNQKFPPVTIQ